MSRLGKRQVTMDLALSLLPDGATIVETGCARSPGNWDGDGMSTVVFGQWAYKHHGRLYSVDIDPEHMNVARTVTRRWAPAIVYCVKDSVAFLRRFRDRIHLLYLDSMDYPHGELRDLYGGKTDLAAAEAQLAAMSEDEILARHRALIEPSQDHAKTEAKTALPRMRSGALVLIDDAKLPGGGKARLARRFLFQNGWVCLADEYQTLWRKP